VTTGHGRLRSLERQTQLPEWRQEEGSGEDDEDEDEEQDEEQVEEEEEDSSNEGYEEEDEGSAEDGGLANKALSEGGADAFGGRALGGPGDWRQLERALRDAQDEVLRHLILPGAARSFEASRTDCPAAAGAAGQQLASPAAAVAAAAAASVAAATKAAALQEPAMGPEETLSELALAVCTLRSATAPGGRREAGVGAPARRLGESPSRAGAALPRSMAASSAASVRATAAGGDVGGSFIFHPPGSSPTASPATLLSPTAGSSGAFVFGAGAAPPAPSHAATGTAAP
jgi:hypothetical protein